MKSKSRLLLLGTYSMLAIIMITMVNADADADADANKAIPSYNDPPIVRGCGQVHIRNNRVIGGHEAAFGSHPWHVALYGKYQGEWEYICGSTLLNDRWVITSVSCIYLGKTLLTNDELKVRLGEWKLFTTTQFSHAEFGIETIEKHPKYHRKHRNNIALLKLNETVSFTQYIVPICLPLSNLNIFHRVATFVGWGQIGETEDVSNVLQEIDVEVISAEECEKWYGAQAKNRIRDENICAGYKEGGRNVYAYDMGGGLTTMVGGKHVLIGIASWGYRAALPKFPGVYTYVQKYMPWIVNTTK